MTANRADLLRADIALLKQSQASVAKTFADPGAEFPECVNCAGFRITARSVKRFTKFGGIVVLDRRRDDEFMFSEFDQGGIDAVHARTGYQANIILARHSGLFVITGDGCNLRELELFEFF